jgi:hypothetical protein
VPPKATGKSGKLPTWAYFAAAAIGLLLVFFLFRKPSETAPQQQTDQQPAADSTDTLGTLSALLEQILAGQHPSSPPPTPGGGGGGGGGGVPGQYPSGTRCRQGGHDDKRNCPTPSGIAEGGKYPCPNCTSGSCISHSNAPDLCA